MIDRLRKSWRQFTASQPGYRFQDRYHRRSSNGRASRIMILGAGVLMALVGLATMPLPIPADGFLVPLGLLLIASEVEPIARFLDRAEVRARGVAERTVALWSGSSVVLKLSVVVAAVLVTAVLGYATYSLVSGD